jgi:prophage regulatory protein
MSTLSRKPPTNNDHAPAPSRLIRRPEVEALTGLPKSTLYDCMAAGTFPSPVKLSGRSVAWHLSEVEAWIGPRQSTKCLSQKGSA